jgi:hypothetical protein
MRQSRTDGTVSYDRKTAPGTAIRVTTSVFAQARSMQMRTSVPAMAPGTGTRLGTVSRIGTMTGRTIGNSHHALPRGCPVCWIHSYFGCSQHCLGLHGTGMVDTGD